MTIASSTDSGSRVFVVSGKVSYNHPATNPTAPKMSRGKTIPNFVVGIIVSWINKIKLKFIFISIFLYNISSRISPKILF
jgi:hypothetical protein